MHKVSVGIVTANYNNGKYFFEYLYGLQKQTVKPDYIVYIDDQSTDNSYNDILEYMKKTHKGGYTGNIGPCATITFNIGDGIDFTLIKNNKNGGPASARNVGLKYLSSKNVMIAGICDSDDVYYPAKIEKSVKIMVKYPQVGLVYSDYDTYNTKTSETSREYKEIFSLEKLIHECIVSNNSFFPLAILEKVGFYDEDPNVKSTEDYLMWGKIAAIAPVYHIPEALYRYRIHTTNLTVATPKLLLAHRLHTCHQKMYAFINNIGVRV